MSIILTDVNSCLLICTTSWTSTTAPKYMLRHMMGKLWHQALGHQGSFPVNTKPNSLRHWGLHFPKTKCIFASICHHIWAVQTYLITTMNTTHLMQTNNYINPCYRRLCLSTPSHIFLYIVSTFLPQHLLLSMLHCATLENGPQTHTHTPTRRHKHTQPLHRHINKH